MHGFLFTVAMSKQNSSAASSLFHGPINKVTVTIDIIAAHNWCVGHFGQRHISHQFKCFFLSEKKICSIKIHKWRGKNRPQLDFCCCYFFLTIIYVKWEIIEMIQKE